MFGDWNFTFPFGLTLKVFLKKDLKCSVIRILLFSSALNKRKWQFVDQ